MDAREAARLIADAVPVADAGTSATVWADLGAGGGTFTEALVHLLGSRAEVHAVDRAVSAVAALERLARCTPGAGRIIPHRADFADPQSWGALRLPPLDGALLANALHFVPEGEQAAVLERVAAALLPGGCLLVVEYEGRRPSRWVPYPVSLERLRLLLPAGAGPLRQIGSRASAYGGSIYAAVATVTREPTP